MILTAAGSVATSCSEHDLPELYVVENDDLESLLFDRNCVGLPFKQNCLRASESLVRHIADELADADPEPAELDTFDHRTADSAAGPCCELGIRPAPCHSRCTDGQVPGVQQTTIAEPYRLGKTLLRENVTILAASRSTETAAEADGNGAFTRVLIDGLQGGATDHRGNVTALGLYGYISGAFDDWEQRPILKTSLTSPLVLRAGPPWIDVELLRRLPVHFPAADARLTLTPAHEGEGRPLARTEDGTKEQQEFDYLGRLRNANLVTTDGKRDHYWVAMESGDVYLTQLGQYFWRLAQRGVL